VVWIEEFACFCCGFVGCFGKSGELVWCFCGEVVVECVVNVVACRSFFEIEK
jgi:hypothetical protein